MEPQAVSPADETRCAIHVGLDLASSVDFTAYCVAEVLERPRPGAPLPPPPYSADDLEKETFYRVQAIDRLPHGLSWAGIGAFVVALLAGIWDEETVRMAGQFASARQRLPRALYADSTGIGGSLIAILEQALHDEPRTADVSVWPVSFIHGMRGYDPSKGTAGKTHIISNLQAKFATNPKRVELPKRDPMMPMLLDEIQAYRISIDRDGMETLGGVGAHDDMVTALALSCLVDSGRWRHRPIRFSAIGY
jgi:hypothetical protein